ncbi:MAG: translation initiation factor IF-2 N-terminal domain-containing protein, partial [Candidatus Nanopelagicales bacterium]
MSKVRVSNVAKELGKSSKEILAWLADNGEYVKSAASTIEAPVVRRLKEAFPAAEAAPEKAPVTPGVAARRPAQAVTPPQAAVPGSASAEIAAQPRAAEPTPAPAEAKPAPAAAPPAPAP